MARRPRKLEDVIARFCKELEKLGVHVERMYLFGSYRHGTQRVHSDIDLVVVSEDFERFGYWERFDVLGVAAVRILEPIESKGLTPKEIEEGKLSTFWKYILEEEAVQVHDGLPEGRTSSPPAGPTPPKQPLRLRRPDRS